MIGPLARWPRALWRLLWVALHLLHGLALVALRVQGRPPDVREPYIRWWSQRLLRLMGVQWEVQGTPRPGAALLVANHVSWLDIASLHAACPQARFVSKADVLRWPLLGWLIRHAGTLFIERERKRDAVRVVHLTAEALQRGDTVAVFPEGTTGPGPQVGPFHANLLQAAISVAQPIQPAVLRYAEPGQVFGPTAAYVGDTTLVGSIWHILCASGLTVHVTFLPPVATAHADRRALAEHLREQVQAVLDRAA